MQIILKKKVYGPPIERRIRLDGWLYVNGLKFKELAFEFMESYYVHPVDELEKRIINCVKDQLEIDITIEEKT